MNKPVIKFVVVNENIFGYINPESANQVGVLASSTIRGATHHWMNGPYPIVMSTQIRPATLKDFADYRIGADQYQNDDDYQVPTE